MANKNSVYKKEKDGSFEFWGYLPTEDVVSALTYTTDIGGINTRLTTAENNISDRYTKGESDGKYAFKNDTQDTIRQASYSPENLYDINPFLFNNLANLIERGGSAECYNSGGSRIKSSADMVPLFRFGNGTFTTIYITDTTNGDFCFDIIIKSPENYFYAGVLSVFLPSYYDGLVLKASAYWGYSSNGTPTVWNAFYNKNGNTALNHHGMYSWIQNNNADTRNWFKIHFEVNQAIPEIRVGLISYAPYDGAISYFLTRNGGTIYDKIQGSITNADHASYADTFIYADKVAVNLTESAVENASSWAKAIFGKDGPYDTHTYFKVVRAEYGTSNGNGSGMFGYYDSGIAWANRDTGGLLTVDWNSTQAKISAGSGMDLNWTRYLVLSESGSSIADQTVRSFTATEIDHGDKFNGDLSSTTLLYAPKMTTIGGLPVKDSNAPEYQKTITGTRSVRFGTATFNLNFSRNAFMDYFFDHGYHFDEETEASTYYRDTGLLCYNEKTYLCTFKYLSNTGDTDFKASLLLTEEEGDGRYLPIDGASASGFDLADKQVTIGNGAYTAKFPNKSGTVAMTTDIPSVPSTIDGLSSSSSMNPLSANQGRVLNNKIAAVADTVSCKIACGLCTVSEDKEVAVTVSGNVISAVATVYRTDNLSGSGNYNERVAVRWSGKTAYIRNDGGQIQISYAVFYSK